MLLLAPEDEKADDCSTDFEEAERKPNAASIAHLSVSFNRAVVVFNGILLLAPVELSSHLLALPLKKCVVGKQFLGPCVRMSHLIH